MSCYFRLESWITHLFLLVAPRSFSSFFLLSQAQNRGDAPGEVFRIFERLVVASTLLQSQRIASVKNINQCGKIVCHSDGNIIYKIPIHTYCTPEAVRKRGLIGIRIAVFHQIKESSRVLKIEKLLYICLGHQTRIVQGNFYFHIGTIT